MAAEPVSSGVWVGDTIPVDPIHDVVGSPDGWLVLDHAAGTSLLRAARFGPGGVPEGEPVGLALPTGWQRGLWDGTSYVVVGVPFTDYYELVASIVAVPVPPAGAFSPAPVEIASGLGWPGRLEGGCGAGPCTIVFEDSHWLADPLTQRIGFDASGATAPQSAIGPTESRTPIAAQRDADATAIVLDGDPVALAWLADDPLVPIDEVALPGVGAPELARAADGTILVGWSHYASNGDSGAPPGEWSVRVMRVRRGEGVLDPAPIDLGPGTLAGVAFTGAGFLVGVQDHPADGDARLVRVGADGAVGATVERSGLPSLRLLVPGPPGQLAWVGTQVDGSAIVWVEADVPDGGLCHDPSACLSGVCGQGVCGGLEAPDTADTAAVDTAVEDSGAARSAACGCAGSPGAVGAGWAALALTLGWSRRRCPER